MSSIKWILQSLNNRDFYDLDRPVLITFCSSSLNPESSRVTAGYVPVDTFLRCLEEHQLLSESQTLTRERDKISLFILTASWFAVSPSYP